MDTPNHLPKWVEVSVVFGADEERRQQPRRPIPGRSQTSRPRAVGRCFSRLGELLSHILRRIQKVYELNPPKLPTVPPSNPQGGAYRGLSGVASMAVPDRTRLGHS